jgi:hypothetical protein
MQAVSAIITHLQAVLMSTGWLACAVTAACEDCAYGLQFVMHVVCFSCDDGIHKCVQVKWPDGSCKECLVPYASLLNHSVRPHIVQYGQLDATTRQLCFPLFRPVSRGHQCFLSYGPLSNLKLMLFYGIAIPDNPYDVVQIELEVRYI